MTTTASETPPAALTPVRSEPLLTRCDCGQTPRAYRVRVPHLTWTVVCKCGERTGYYSGGKNHAVEAWNRSANAAGHGAAKPYPAPACSRKDGPE